MTSVALPEIDQQTRDELVINCEGTWTGNDCGNEATHVARWTRTCDCGDTTAFYCLEHADLLRWVDPYHWACAVCDLPVTLISVVSL